MRLLGTVPASTMKSSAVHYQKGDVLYGRLRPYLNKVLTVGFEGLASAEFIPLSMPDGVKAEFIQYLLNTSGFVSFTSKLDTGDRPRVDYEQISAYEVLLPTTKEQHRIVEAIESYLARLDDAVATLERVQRNLKRYRASVLKAAVEGRLVPTEAPEVFEEQNWVQLDSVLDSLDQGWSPKCEKQPSETEEDWGVIKTTAVQPLAYLQGQNKRLPDSLGPRPHLELKIGDILVTRAGPRKRTGVCCLVRQTRKRLMLCDKTYRLRTNNEVALNGYLELALNAPQIQKAIEKLKTGISDSGVNLTQGRFKLLRLPMPNIESQREIEAEVQRIWSLTDSTAQSVDVQLHRCRRLRQSILKWAFEGKLVDQDPNDEPASDLLERIKAERATNESTKKTTGRGRKRRTS